jgi:glycyl-tRNA synthetase beta chain
MPELLVEIGCEEIPAHSVAKACNQLADILSESVCEMGLAEAGVVSRTAFTPRRLIVSISGVRSRQDDRMELRRGPSAKAAYLADGTASPALLGFCKSAGIEAAAVEIRDDYVWANVSVVGKSAVELLSQTVPQCVAEVSFDKTMRWGSGRMRFARPIRWIVCVLGGKVVPFQIEDVDSGSRSFGHRFLYPERFEVSSFDDLIANLRSRAVIAEFEERRQMIAEMVQERGADAERFSNLVDENANLVELPSALEGGFREQFLDLPECVLIETMRKHLRFFPVYDGESLSNRFVSITNGKTDDTVRRGNEWVLNARFNDAKFFFEEDKKHTLEQFLQATERMMFQEKLGTIRQRADRLSSLAREFAKLFGLPEPLQRASEKAGLFAKADLSTGLVSELPSLQGKVGSEYAKREGFDPVVCEAIARQYDADVNAKTDGMRVAVVAMCADAADRLAGFLHIGEKPSGSSDPNALRRAATQLIEAQLKTTKREATPWQLIKLAAQQYRAQGFSFGEDSTIQEDVKDLLFGRYELILSGIRFDARAAAWSANWDDTAYRLTSRAKVIASLADDIDFVRTAKRPGNIVAAAVKKGLAIGRLNPADLSDPAERGLHDAAADLQPKVASLSEEAEFEQLADQLRTLHKPIASFFDQVMVMVEDEAARSRRLALLHFVDGLFKTLGDFDKIVIEGE